jgi:hypothetical protein
VLGHVRGAVARLAARCAATVHAGKAGASPRLRWEGPLAAWPQPCACPLPSPRSTPRPDCTRLASSPARVLTCNALHCCSIWQGRVGQRLRSEGGGRVQRAGQQHITERGGGAARPREEAHLALWEGGERQRRQKCEEKEERSALEDAVSAQWPAVRRSSAKAKWTNFAGLSPPQTATVSRISFTLGLTLRRRPGNTGAPPQQRHHAHNQRKAGKA